MGAYEQVDQDVGWSVRTRGALRMDVPSQSMYLYKCVY